MHLLLYQIFVYSFARQAVHRGPFIHSNMTETEKTMAEMDSSRGGPYSENRVPLVHKTMPLTFSKKISWAALNIFHVFCHRARTFFLIFKEKNTQNDLTIFHLLKVACLLSLKIRPPLINKSVFDLIFCY